jgi:uncharacterized membrane protein
VANTALVLVLSAMAYYRRLSVPHDERFVLSVSLPRWVWPRRSFTGKALTVLAAATALIAAGTFVFAFFNPLDRETFTEFYLLGPDGRAGNYTQELALGQTMTTTVVVVNEEQEPMAYEVEMRVNGTPHGDRIAVTDLAPGDTWKSQVRFTASQASTHKVEFLLYRDGQSEPYRRVHLWLEVSQGPS